MNVRALSIVATGIVGETTAVYPAAEPGRLGRAGWASAGPFWEIVLNPALESDPAELLRIFAHEVGHLRLGHCPRQVVTSAGEAAMWASLTPENRGRVAAGIQEQEAAAWAYGARLAPQIEAACKAHGATWAELAIG